MKATRLNVELGVRVGNRTGKTRMEAYHLETSMVVDPSANFKGGNSVE